METTRPYVWLATKQAPADHHYISTGAACAYGLLKQQRNQRSSIACCTSPHFTHTNKHIGFPQSNQQEAAAAAATQCPKQFGRAGVQRSHWFHTNGPFPSTTWTHMKQNFCWFSLPTDAAGGWGGPRSWLRTTPPKQHQGHGATCEPPEIETCHGLRPRRGRSVRICKAQSATYIKLVCVGIGTGTRQPPELTTMPAAHFIG
jgi:hypothetical protein